MDKPVILKYPLTSFVVINYLVSWIFLYPCYQLIINAKEGTFPFLALIGLIGAYGPTIAAIIVTNFTSGKDGIKNLFKKYLIWNVNWGWYLFILFVPISIYAISVWSSVILGYHLGQLNLKEGVASILTYLLLALPFGPMGEELGWRGFMLPRLLQKYNVWGSSLILGLVWTFWHLASFTFPGAAIPSIFSVSAWTVFLFLLNILAETLFMTAVFLNTKGSVLIAILLHAAFNASSNIVLTTFPQVENNVAQIEIIYIVNIILTTLMSIVFLLSSQYVKNMPSDDVPA